MIDIPNPWLTYSEATHSRALDTAAAIIDPDRLAAAVVIPSSDANSPSEVSAGGAPLEENDPVVTQDYAPAEINHIHEIFHVARKLLAEDSRRAEDFVDFEALEQSLAEPLPMFLRDDGYLKRRA